MPTIAALALGKVPLFSGLSESDLERVATASRTRRYTKGSVLFHEGDPGDYLLVLIRGRAKVVLQSQHGQEVILAVIERRMCLVMWRFWTARLALLP